jgi:hypothetical protein
VSREGEAGVRVDGLLPSVRLAARAAIFLPPLPRFAPDFRLPQHSPAINSPSDLRLNIVSGICNDEEVRDLFFRHFHIQVGVFFQTFAKSFD